MTPLYPIYPVRIDKDLTVRTLDGTEIGAASLALAIIAGFEHATPMRTTEEVVKGTGVKVRGKAG